MPPRPSTSVDWRAQWVWAAGEASPRNAWRCFRRVFETAEAPGSARLHITADSRYVLYVNGERVGRGPARSWPFQQSYDTHEIGPLLRPGPNVLAVLVMHYGVSSFQYVRGRGGLLAQLELPGGPSIGTDSSWTTVLHAGHDPRSPRMSVQLGFAERVDARDWDDGWTTLEYDDSAWDPATVVGPVGTPPWTTLVPRDIPHLAETPRDPARVVSLRAVTPVRYTAALDICVQMMPGSADHSNAVRYAGYLATLLHLDERARVTLGSPLATVSVFGDCWVNGERCTGFAGDDPERCLALELPAGEHLLLIETTGDDRSGVGLHLVLDCETPFTLRSPLGGEAETPFVTLGPFDEMVVLDHQPSRALAPGEGYERVKEARSAADLLAFGEWLRPVPAALLSRDDVFAACVRVREATEHPVLASLQHVPFSIPLFTGRDTELILDFGAETSGYLELEVDAPEGTVLDLYGFEHFRDGWRQDTHLLDNTLRYICREGRQRCSSLVRRGFRYAMLVVRGASRPAALLGVRVRESTYPVTDIGRFECSDPLLNAIWEMSRRTLLLCMEDTYVDCPAYEQTFWVGDARNAALVNRYLFGATDLTERCLRLVPPSRVHTPLYADQVPSGWNSVIPNWTFLWVIACLEHVEHTGDAAFARELWPHVRFTLQAYLDKLDERGLLRHYGWNFLDWAPIDQPQDGVVAHQTMFLARALRAGAALARRAGSDGTTLDEAAAALKVAINAHLWSDARGAYLDALHVDDHPSSTFSLQTQVVAYVCGVAEGERKERLERHLTSPPRDFVRIGSPFVSFFYYEALVELGRFDLLLEDIRRNYGAMLEHGATTCWEMYPGPENRANPKFPTRSHCHAWSAGPGYFLSTFVLGVQFPAEGGQRLRIAPRSGGLEWAKGRIPLPQGGYVDVNWTVGKGTSDSCR
jgi:alpha-L-rhamnosidase